MTVKSDINTEIGMHVFERAGLGKAPFKCVGFHVSKYQACQGAPVQPGSSCDYCGTGIMYVCEIKSADGNRFKVGTDCVYKTGDGGLIRAYKTTKEFRLLNREKAKARDERVTKEWEALVADEAASAALTAFTITNHKNQREPWLDFAKRAWGYCGASGRARYLKAAKEIIAGKVRQA